MSKIRNEFYESVNGSIEEESEQLLLISRACIYINELETKLIKVLNIATREGYEEDFKELKLKEYRTEKS